MSCGFSVRPGGFCTRNRKTERSPRAVHQNNKQEEPPWGRAVTIIECVKRSCRDDNKRKYDICTTPKPTLNSVRGAATQMRQARHKKGGVEVTSIKGTCDKQTSVETGHSSVIMSGVNDKIVPLRLRTTGVCIPPTTIIFLTKKSIGKKNEK